MHTASSEGKWPRLRVALRNSAFDAFDQVGGVDDSAHFRGEIEERDDQFPGPPPAADDAGVLAAEVAVGERV